MGGQADAVTANLRQHYSHGMALAEALRVGVQALSAVSPATSANGGGHEQLPAEQIEVAVLDRRRPKRAFRRITGATLRSLLADEPVAEDTEPSAEAAATHAPSAPAPGTPPGLGDPKAVDTVGGTEEASAQPDTQDDAGGGTDGSEGTER
jgi:proteasome alpha subunit